MYLARTIYINVDSPSLYFPYFYIFEVQLKNISLYKLKDMIHAAAQ